MSDPSPVYLTLSQVAARTGRHPELLRQWCAAGRIPCHRLGGSWVLEERDLELLGRMATRARRRTATPGPLSGHRRTLAAVFDDREHARAGADALRTRLALDAAAIETAPIGLRALGALGLTVVAGKVPVESILDARRILAAFGGRIVAELDGDATAAVARGRSRTERRARHAASP